MAVIRNRLNQRLVINLNSGRSIDILAKGAANISDEECLSSHVQALGAKGDIMVIQDREEKQPAETTKYTAKKQLHKKTKK